MTVQAGAEEIGGQPVPIVQAYRFEGTQELPKPIPAPFVPSYHIEQTEELPAQPLPAPIQTIQTINETENSAGESVEITAPSNFVRGYVFDVEIGQDVYSYTATRDVRSGENVTVPFSDLERSSLPHGRFRDGLCDCCRLGCCHPSLCMGLFCTPVLLAQIMTRLKLDWCGKPSKSYYWTFCVIMMILIVGYLLRTILSSIASAITVAYQEEMADAGQSEESDETKIPPEAGQINSIQNLIEAIVGFYILYLMARTRRIIRLRSNIPPQCCQSCEDFCCSCWCSACTVMQMARHTADYESKAATCCSATGLST